VSIPIQKLAASNCAAADLEIDSKKLWCCRLWNQQQNYAAADLEIDSQKLCCCRFLKSAAKNRATADLSARTVLLPTQKSAATVESF
jgi:hypothetical protein